METTNVVGQAYKLLVVDDEDYALEGIMKTIDWASLGITDVYGADCVQNAKIIMKHHAPEIIICDIEMAEESGIDFLRWLHDGGYKYRLLFLTAHARFDYAKEAIGLGAFDYFLKPVEHRILKEAVERALADLQQELSLYDSQKLDFYGLNFYNGLFDNADREKARQKADPSGGNYQDRPQSHPEKLVDVLHMLVDKYKVDIPIYITENGLPHTEEKNDLETLLNDQSRIGYIQNVLLALHQAMEEGIDVRGYYVWTLMDNFEWSAGYAPRYGLYYTDLETLERIPKKSAVWYRNVIRDQGFEI